MTSSAHRGSSAARWLLAAGVVLALWGLLEYERVAVDLAQAVVTVIGTAPVEAPTFRQVFGDRLLGLDVSVAGVGLLATGLVMVVTGITLRRHGDRSTGARPSVRQPEGSLR